MDEFPCSVMAGVRVVAFWRGGGVGGEASAPFN